MVICSETGWNDTYTIRMISGNKIPGLLRFHEKWLDGTSRFYYDITSRQPLNRLTEYKKMTGTELHTLISDLILVLRQMERYLLDERRICLRPEYIYIEPETYHGSFCLIPGYWSDFAKEFLEFAQYILDHVDHSDGGAVVLALSVFRESRKENFGVDDIERCLGKKQKTEEIVEVPKQKYEIVPKEEQKDEREKCNIPCIALIIGMIVLPLCGIFLFGTHVLLRWKWMIFIFEMLLATAGIVIYYFSKSEACDEKGLEISDEFELGDPIWDLSEEIEKEMDTQTENHLEPESEDDMETVLLISKTELIQKRRLISLSDSTEISVDYFPFLIGKNKGLVDAYLNEPGVSRLHAKLEREGTDYFITDLNSTNGTKINGSLLGANEKKQIRMGDELDFAGILFRFQ